MFLVPIPKFIDENFLTRNFYNNHIFYQCDYDEKIYINLNGRALELSSTHQFQTYLGFKDNLTFNIVEQLKMELSYDNVTVVYIDNLIDEKLYAKTTNTDPSSFKKDSLKRCSNKDEYVSSLQMLSRKNEELKEIDILLSELCDKLQYNYIIIKNHTSTYSKYFKELGQEFRQVDNFYFYYFNKHYEKFLFITFTIVNQNIITASIHK